MPIAQWSKVHGKEALSILSQFFDSCKLSPHGDLVSTNRKQESYNPIIGTNKHFLQKKGIIFHNAHFDRYYPHFWWLLTEMTTLQNFGVPDPPKVGRTRYVSVKKHDLGPIFRTKSSIWPISNISTPPPWYTSLESYGSQPRFGSELSRF